ncbi:MULTISPECIES: hypothetical protein [Corynebacterium]|uniref:Uncharacterized protein n=1 Tax=Corynebacterium hadale TaxID=2026255 RepID=A0A269PDC7_9CORY|nr:hypothetical protein [Corynebacterium hadale]PAJ69716.1 hypothetical protein CIG21_07340 [Corynebacterium hadale]WKC60434.1 hypothetical protein CHAD_07845 [Corynebacterium hadale]
MLCHKIKHTIGTAVFVFDPSISILDMEEAQHFEMIDGKHFDVLESCFDSDGSPYPRYGLTESIGMLVAPADAAPAIRDALNQQGARIAECTFTSQYGDYIGFRAFNLHEDTPQAPVFRIRTSPDNPDLWMDQYYSSEFVDWLKANFDTRGIQTRTFDQDPHYNSPEKK